MTLNAMRVWFGHYAKWVMGFMFVAMVVTTFSWNGLGRGANQSGSAAPVDPAEVVAKVDGEPVTREAVDTAVDTTQQEFSQYGGGSITLSMEPFVRSQAMQSLEQQEEMLAKAQKMGLTASSDEIQAAREKIVTEQDARKRLGLPANASFSQVDTAYQQQTGSTFEDRFPDDQMREAVVLKKLQDSITKGIIVSEQDARNSFTQYHTQHILIDNKKRSDAQALLRANEILAKVKAPGADFSALARQYSEDPGTAKQGGDDGWIDQNKNYVDEFKTAAFALQPGQVTQDLVKSPQFGYFIIKLEATRSNLPKDFDANKAKYISQLQQTKQQQAEQKFTQEVQSEPHTIVMIDPELKGDKAMDDAQRMQPPDAVKQAALYNQAIGYYQKAIKNTQLNQSKAEMYLQVANAYQQLKNTSAQADALQSALKMNGSTDPNMLVQLGDLYKQLGKNDLAITEYQAASTASWNNVGTHQQLARDYDDLGRKDLGDSERTWVVNYNKAHPPAASNGMNFTGGPGGGQPITIMPSSGKPAKATVTPVQ